MSKDTGDSRRLGRKARELRRGKVLDELIKGNLDTGDIADKFNVSDRTVRRDKAFISSYFANQFHSLSSAIPAIHTQMLMGYFRILQIANQLIDGSQDPNVKIAAGYLAMSNMNKIIELTGSNNKLIDHYMQQFRKKTEIERRAFMQGRPRR